MDVSSFSQCVRVMVNYAHIGPGSFCEVRKILPLLTEASPNFPSFHVVAFSLPGYGFSAAPQKRGFNIAQYAEVRYVTHACMGPSRLTSTHQIGHKVMLSLGYNEYGACSLSSVVC